MGLSAHRAVFRDDGSLTIREQYLVGGVVALFFAAAAAYPLFIRTELYDGPPGGLWLFRLLFCGGFGLAGLAGIADRVEARFDPAARSFVHVSRSLFSRQRTEGDFEAIRCVRLTLRVRPGSALNDHLAFARHTYSLALVCRSRELPLLSTTVRPANPRRTNEIDGLHPEELAERLAALVGRPLERVETS